MATMSPAIGFVDLLARVGVHLEHAADALALFLDRVLEHGAGFEVARVDAAEGQRAHVRVVGDLERQHRQRLVVGRVTLDLGFSVLTSMPLIAGMSIGDGRKSMTPSSSGCTPLFLKAEPQNTGKKLRRSIVPLRIRRRMRVVVRHFAVEVRLGRRIVDFDDGLDQLLAVLRRRCP